MDTREHDDECWQLLHDKILGRSERGSNDLALIVGAGVSGGTGGPPMMPGWNDLIDELSRAVGLSKEELHVARTAGWPQPRILEAIRGCANEKWPEPVRSCLYEQISQELQAEGLLFPEARDEDDDERKQSDPKFVEYMKRRNPTLAALVELCAVTRKDTQKWRANPRVAAVLTYNIDALLQNYDRARHGSPRILRTIERASKRRHPGKIPLYHLHGLLLPNPPRTPRDGIRKETSDSLVLSERDYHERTDAAYSFATTTMLWALREFVCVFVGCSMSDELMRRYLYRGVDECRRAGEQKTRTRHFAVVEHGSLDRLIEKDLARLGVSPLWVDNYKELPGRIEALASAFAREFL